jgi:hypothetical protein
MGDPTLQISYAACQRLPANFHLLLLNMDGTANATITKAVPAIILLNVVRTDTSLSLP